MPESEITLSVVSHRQNALVAWASKRPMWRWSRRETGAALSLQRPGNRAEHRVVVRGTARVTRGNSVVTPERNQPAYRGI